MLPDYVTLSIPLYERSEPHFVYYSQSKKVIVFWYTRCTFFLTPVWFPHHRDYEIKSGKLFSNKVFVTAKSAILKTTKKSINQTSQTKIAFPVVKIFDLEFMIRYVVVVPL